MSEKIRVIILAVTLFAFSLSTASAHEDDYLVGLNAFRDGLYEISLPSFEEYLKGETEQRKAEYAHYLLYRMYLADKKFDSSVKHLNAVFTVDDRRFDKAQMVTDKMLLLTKTDCAGAAEYLKDVTDEVSINFYLDSKCEVGKDTASLIIEKTALQETKLKVISRFSEDPAMVGSIFDSLDIAKLNDEGKKYFALYFYKSGDMERFSKVSAVYEDEDIAGLELDRLWKGGDKDAFIGKYETFKKKYTLTGANACRAVDVYKNKGVQFDCDIINECMQKYSVEFVQVKGACLVKNGNKEKVTEFIDSLKPSIFTGMCGYGEYVFYNDMYTGSAQSKFYQCEGERYKIADILLSKGENQAVVNMFYNKEGDQNLYYAAVALRKLGKQAAADETASKITDEALKTKYNGGVQ
jgi:tetratricopeptide (TPR) repeat protein